MPSVQTWTKTKDHASALLKQVGCVLIDAALLIPWLILQWGISEVSRIVVLGGVDAWVTSVFQVVFAVSTLLVILIYLYADLRIVVIRARKRIEEETRVQARK
jgi:hypothetical protein